MTCDDYQGLIIDIARGDAVDRASREEARRHAALCAQCGAQQQEQQWLTAQFRAIAQADEQRNAPERVEIAALAAWRATYAKTATNPVLPAAIATAATPPTSARVIKGPWLMSGLAAAGLAAAAMLTMFLWPTSQSQSRLTPVTSSPVAESTSARANVETPTTSGTVATVARNTESRGGREDVVPTERPRALRTASMTKTAQRDEFLPLPYVEPLRSTEARHVVRVSMTSGDEMIIGVLPADRRNGQPFEADVLVGEDGIARAIRVVR
jgi:hypothetical protein